MTATPNNLRAPGESRETAEPVDESPRPGYGWCDVHQGNAWISFPTVVDGTTGIHGTCQGCHDGRPLTKRAETHPVFPHAA